MGEKQRYYRKLIAAPESPKRWWLFWLILIILLQHFGCGVPR